MCYGNNANGGRECAELHVTTQAERRAPVRPLFLHSCTPKITACGIDARLEASFPTQKKSSSNRQEYRLAEIGPNAANIGRGCMVVPPNEVKSAFIFVAFRNVAKSEHREDAAAEINTGQ
jgi:hypothetical protein